MELIKVENRRIGGAEVNSVNLRDVHAFVESRQQFGNWATNRLADFAEDVDYIANKIINKENGMLVSVNYIVTLDAAKHISMIERNEKGKQLRQYFIDCERKLLTQNNDMVIASTMNSKQLALLLRETEAKEVAIAQLEQAKPDIMRSERFLSHGKDMSVGEFAKTYNRKGFGQNKMFQWLRDNGYLRGTQAKQQYINAGYFRVIQTSNDYGTFTKTLITTKGFDYFVKKLDNIENNT